MLAALDGAQLIIVPSASPARGVVPERGRLGPAGEPVALESDRAGHRGRARRLRRAGAAGGLRGRQGVSRRIASWRGRGATCWREARCSRRRCMPATLDFEEITRARADLPLLADLEMRLPHLLGSLHDARRRRQAGRRTGRGRTPRPSRQGQAAPAAAAARAGPAADARNPDARPARDRSRAHPALAGRVHPRRGAAPARIRAGGGRPLGRRGQLAGGVPRRGGARAGQRARRPHAVPDLEPGEPGARPAGDRRARHPRARPWTSARPWTVSRRADPASADARPAGQHHGARPG